MLPRAVATDELLSERTLPLRSISAMSAGVEPDASPGHTGSRSSGGKGHSHVSGRRVAHERGCVLPRVGRERKHFDTRLLLVVPLDACISDLRPSATPVVSLVPVSNQLCNFTNNQIPSLSGKFSRAMPPHLTS